MTRQDNQSVEREANAGSQPTLTQQIVEAAMKRDPEALAALYDELFPGLYRVVWFTTRDEEVTHEIVSAVIPRTLAAVHAFDTRAPTARAWLFSMAWEILQREHKHVIPALGYHLPPHFLDESAQNTVEVGAESDALAAALHQLPSLWQNIVVLRYFGGLESREVAYVLSRKEESVERIETEALAEIGYWLQGFARERNGPSRGRLEDL
jgi:RNA polymerase sigma factor (sigma-70 family)